MAQGTIIQFNVDRGYGFIEQDTGGDDVFVHFADLPDPATSARRGTRVEYNVLRNDRGLKACDITVIGSPPGTQAPARHTSSITVATVGEQDDCIDVMSTSDYEREITDALIDVLPSIVATQILSIRQRLATAASHRGWLED
jgi:cold shock protein